MRIKLVISMMVMLFLSGCITYSNNRLGQASSWPVTNEDGKLNAITLRVTGQRQFKGGASPTPPAMVQAWEKSIVKYYKDSGLFSDVVTGRNEAVIYADVVLTNNENSNLVLAAISGFTFAVIPATGQNTLTMETTFRNSKGDVIGKVEKAESVTTWIQILLIFGMPFSVSLDEVIGEIVKHTLNEAAEKGYLKKA